jgi:hypothetical protein
MGVYVFKSRHADYVKVGHFRGDDAWDRVRRRGFYSCVSPRELKSLRSASDLELLAWYPSLTTKHEKLIHRTFRSKHSVGEWHPATSSNSLGESLDDLERRQIEDTSAPNQERPSSVSKRSSSYQRRRPTQRGVRGSSSCFRSPLDDLIPLEKYSFVDDE